MADGDIKVEETAPAEVERALLSPRVNDELKRKLHFIQAELARGRTASDAAYLKETRRMLMREARKVLSME